MSCTPLTPLRRPKILIQAARAGLGKTCPDTLLKRVLGSGATGTLDRQLHAILEKESEFEAHRKSDRPGYNVAGHVQCLIAVFTLAQAKNAA